MSRSNGYRAAYVLLLMWGALALCYGYGCSPCHTGHYEVFYSEAYTTTERHEVGDNTYYTTKYHPEECSATFFCDVRCDTLDKGKAEAHEKHPVKNLYGDKVDQRCTNDGYGWRVR